MTETIRASIAYALASLAAALTFMSPSIWSELSSPMPPPDGTISLEQEIMTVWAAAAALFAIPAFLVISKHWPRGGPGLMRCVIGGAVLGASFAFFALILIGTPSPSLNDVAPLARGSGFVGLCGGVAGLVFWTIAIWPRRKELPLPPA